MCLRKVFDLRIFIKEKGLNVVYRDHSKHKIKQYDNIKNMLCSMLILNAKDAALLLIRVPSNKC